MNTQGPIRQAYQIALEHEAGDIPIPVPVLHGNAGEAKALPDSESEDSHVRTQCSPNAGSDCADTLHEVANTITAVLMHAQMLEWKLPPYSRLKRSVRAIEHHAQRGGALLRRLRHQFQAEEEVNQRLCRQVPSLHGTMAGATAMGPDTTAGEPPILPPLPSASGSHFPPEREFTSFCDPCTSSFFPKEER